MGMGYYLDRLFNFLGVSRISLRRSRDKAVSWSFARVESSVTEGWWCTRDDDRKAINWPKVN